MKKILVAIDALHPDMKTVDFACYIGRLTHSKITGVFLENFIEEFRPMVKSDYNSTYVDWEIDESSPQHKQKMLQIEKNIELFTEACSKRAINSEVYRDAGVPSTETIAETRFADLLIVGAETNFSKRYEGTPSGFVKSVLKEAECPVIITPESFDGIDEIIFCYDGSRSAAFAIRQFDYLLPELRNIPSILLEVNKQPDTRKVDKEKLKKWMLQHNTNFQLETLQGEAKDELFAYLLLRKNALIVMGAFGRNLLSTLFRKSTAERIIKTTSLPLFIAHY